VNRKKKEDKKEEEEKERRSKESRPVYGVGVVMADYKESCGRRVE
jgi:hypothetical protein